MSGLWITMIAAAVAGDVYVKADVEGARILLDGEDTGQRTPTMLEGVGEGTHEIRVLDDATCRLAYQDVVVRADAIERADLTLVEGGGWLTVTSEPNRATVSFDGAVLGDTPLERHRVPCGQGSVEISMEGFAAQTKAVDVALDQELPIGVLLQEAQTGTLVVAVKPLEAEIRLDDQPVGVGPMTLDQVSQGQHLVTARMSGYAELTQHVTIATDQTARVDLELEKLPSLSERTGLNRVRWSTVGVGTGLAAGAVAVGVVARQQYNAASANYLTYQTLSYADEPEAFYASEVHRPRRMSFVLAGTAGALALGSAASWVLLPVMDPQTPGVALSATF